MTDQKGPKIVRIAQVAARTGMSRSTIYVAIKEGRFPKPVQLKSHMVGWVASEVGDWIRERIRERDTKTLDEIVAQFDDSTE